MHETYLTEGYVLSARPHKEDSTEVSLFTRELGRVHAVAQAARRPGATFAASTQTGTRAVYALVKGRYYWRIVGMHEVTQLPYTLSSKHKRAYFRILRLCARLLPHEEVVDEAYRDFASFVEDPNPTKESEAKVVFTILSSLGYADKAQEFTSLKEQIQEINRGIHAAGL